MPTRNITEIVRQFSGANDRGRYVLLCAYLRGPAETKREQNFRAKLCTALDQQDLYPTRSYVP